MLLFTVANAIGFLLTVSFFAYIYVAERHLLVKPSVIVLAFFHIRIQLAAALSPGWIHDFLPDPWDFLLIVHGFALLGLMGAFLFGRKSARAVWERIAEGQPSAAGSYARAVWPLMLLIAAITAVFLSEVPLGETGLAAMVRNPAAYAVAREESLKLLTNPIIRYGFAFLKSSLAPLIVALFAIRLWEHRSDVGSILAALGIVIMLAVVSLPGARGPAGFLLLTVFLALYYRSGLPFRPGTMILAALGVLALPVVFTVLRQGAALSFETWFRFFADSILGRAFRAPMEIGVYYTHYAQTHGPEGLLGIGRVAKLAGAEAANLPNQLGLTYMRTDLTTVNMNGGFLFTYYLYFGPWSLLIVLPALWVLDFVLCLYRRLSGVLLVPTLAAVSVACNSFVTSDYTTVFVTHGFAVIPVVALILQGIQQFNAIPPEASESVPAVSPDLP